MLVSELLEFVQTSLCFREPCVMSLLQHDSPRLHAVTLEPEVLTGIRLQHRFGKDAWQLHAKEAWLVQRPLQHATSLAGPPSKIIQTLPRLHAFQEVCNQIMQVHLVHHHQRIVGYPAAGQVAGLHKLAKELMACCSIWNDLHTKHQCQLLN